MPNVTNTNHAQPPATTAERNLQQAADTAENSNWATARLIACSVEAGKPGPKPSSHSGSENSKTSIVQAAGILRKSQDTIRAYLAAWNTAAADGHCTPASDLTPEDGWTADLPAADLWETYRNPNSHSAKPEPKGIPADPVKAIAQAVPKLTPEQKREMVAEVIASDPQAAPKPTPEQTNEMVRDAILADPVTANVADNALEERTRRAEEKWGPKMAHIKEQKEAERKDSDLRVMLEINNHLRKAQHWIKQATKELEGTNLSGDYRDDVEETAERTMQHLLLFKSMLNGETVDWDAALADLTAGE